MRAQVRKYKQIFSQYNRVGVVDGSRYVSHSAKISGELSLSDNDNQENF